MSHWDSTAGFDEWVRVRGSVAEEGLCLEELSQVNGGLTQWWNERSHYLACKSFSLADAFFLVGTALLSPGQLLLSVEVISRKPR